MLILIVQSATSSPLLKKQLLLPDQSLILKKEALSTSDSAVYKISITKNKKIVYSDTLRFDLPEMEIGIKDKDWGTYEVILSNLQTTETIAESFRVIPGWFSIIPPLLAILLALITRQVLIALFLGIYSGSIIIYYFNPVEAFARMLDTILINALNAPEKISIIIFTLVLGGVVGIISKNGGTLGIVQHIRHLATNRRRGMLATFMMGIFIFFDDYANTLIVGNTMRPLTDRLKISREKLAYLIDSTAAPVANIAIISTWIGYELSILADNLHHVHHDYNPYLFFIKSISYNFYPIFSLIFILILILLNHDFGPMFKAERRAHHEGKLLQDNSLPLSNFSDPSLQPEKNIVYKWYNGFLPILTIIIVTMVGLIISGMENLDPSILGSDISFFRKISLIVGQSDSFSVLMWASFAGTLAAVAMSLFQKIMNLHIIVESWIAGTKAMLPAILILSSAWAIGLICEEINTADYVVQLSHRYISAHLLPIIIFITAALISFATGTSWGTMAILLPITIPLSNELAIMNQLDPSHTYSILLVSFTAVLAGATFGDHCSPISDTTIMSSMASGSDHIDHVRTQLPYAIVVAIISILAGYLPAGFDFPPVFSIIIGTILIFGIIYFLGKKVETT
ncbi:MAG: Na+/H+ antiporter NhaC family protein [Calditrichia bacterium]